MVGEVVRRPPEPLVDLAAIQGGKDT